MGLSRKTFCYSMLLSTLLVLCIIGYFVFMLPSLYVDYVQRSDYQSVIALQKQYSKTQNYEGLTLKNPTGTVTIEIPEDGNTLFLTSRLFRITLTVKDEELLALLNTARSLRREPEALRTYLDENAAHLKEIFIPENISPDALLPEGYPLQLDLLLYAAENFYEEESSRMYVVSDTMVVFESTVWDGNTQYTSYAAISNLEDSIILTVLPVMTPQMREIRPIVTGSLPMITAVVFLFVLFSSSIFSRHIINPILRLVSYTESAKLSGRLAIEPVEVSGRDEISMLAKTLNGLYKQLHDSYRELEDKNRNLLEINKRQEVFLRASSHQLKTPVAAALLLTDGMINEVGKYRNVKEYLPEVKKQLKSMQKIIEDILYLNHCAENLESIPFSLTSLITDSLQNYRIQIADKNLAVSCGQQDVIWESDREIVRKIIDNLVSNAIQFTPPGEHIDICPGKDSLVICNYGAVIEEELLPHIYEPFVTSSTEHRGHGLGLYVASYYAGLCGLTLSVRNRQGGVEARLELR